MISAGVVKAENLKEDDELIIEVKKKKNAFDESFGMLNYAERFSEIADSFIDMLIGDV